MMHVVISLFRAKVHIPTVFITKDLASSLFSRHEDIIKALQLSEIELSGFRNNEAIAEHSEL